MEKIYKKRKTYKVKVTRGKGIDKDGIERNYKDFVNEGEVVVSIPRDNREYARYQVHDYETGEKWDYDFGRLQGRAVIPFRVKVYFGKVDYVSLGYQMRNDGSYYYRSYTSFRNGRNKRYERSKLRELHERTEKCPEALTMKYGWLLPDETKEAIEAEMKEATSGKYRYEIDWEITGR